MIAAARKQFTIERDLKMLFIGETGSGKSTLINQFINVLFGVGYEGNRKIAIPYNEKVDIDVRGESTRTCKRLECNIPEFSGRSSEQADVGSENVDESESQTIEPEIYGIRDRVTGKTLTIIDTPGLNDTKGSEVDEQPIQKLINILCFVGGVNLVCIVHNGTEPRLKKSSEVALKRLLNIFSKACLQNIVVCLSHSPSSAAPNCLDSLQQLGIEQSRVFCFENSCLVHPESLRQLCVKEFGAVHEDVEGCIAGNAKFWRHNTEAVERLLQHGYTVKNLDIEGVKALYVKREAAEKQIQVLADKIRVIEEKLAELQQQQEIVEQFRELRLRNQGSANAEAVQVLEKRKRKVSRVGQVKRYHYEERDAVAFGEEPEKQIGASMVEHFSGSDYLSFDYSQRR